MFKIEFSFEFSTAIAFSVPILSDFKFAKDFFLLKVDALLSDEISFDDKFSAVTTLLFL